MDSTMELLEHANPTTIFIIIVLTLLAIKEIWGLISWFVGKVRDWHKKESKREDKEESTEDRLKRLEDHDLKQYERLNNIEETLNKMTDVLESQQEIIADIKIDGMRKTILDFASCCGDKKRRATREQFANILKLYDSYEAFLKKAGRTNGEAELSIRIIQQEYEKNLLNHNFVEDNYDFDEEY